MIRNIGTLPTPPAHPPLRAVALWNGRLGYRCDVCGCGVSSWHTPGSSDCQEGRRERLISQST